jgi:predicted NAD/FAD-dependent oxidoreductase
VFHIAIVGAGMAGLSCAETLSTAGVRVTLFDKGRGPGGRMASRRIETTQGTAEFDFGAQYFTARDAYFADQVRQWERDGVVARWPAARHDAFLGTPTMNAILRHMCSRHEVHFSSLVKGVLRRGQQWQLVGEGRSDEVFDGVVLALPAEQAAPIMTLHDFDLAQAALYARSQPSWTGMFAFAQRLSHETGIIRDSGIIAWAARNNAKPGRSGPEGWVVQAAPRWSIEHLEQSPDAIAPYLLAALEAQTGGGLPEVIGQSIHRWRYGLSAGTGVGCLWNEALRLGACGDWLKGPRVECAWMSGRLLAERMIARRSISAE